MPNPSEFDLTKVFRYILSPGFLPYFFSIDFVFHLVVASTALSLHEPLHALLAAPAAGGVRSRVQSPLTSSALRSP